MTRLPALVFSLVALTLAASAAALADADRADRADRVAATRPGVELPTAAALERRTERFLARRRGAGESPRGRPGDAGGAVAGGADGRILDESRVVALYGAPQMGRTILGLRSPPGAARKLARQSFPYEQLGGRPVIGAFDLVSVFATAGGGPDNLYRSRQDADVIAIYLEQARAVGARLMLDIQPGRSTFLAELEALSWWVAQPDVDVAIDPEWNVGPDGIPGQTLGGVTAREVNRVSGALQRLIESYGLPPKLLVVHQYRRRSVRQRARLRRRPDVEVVLNFDGIGTAAAKQAGYVAYASPRVANGFSLFYRLDTGLMAPGEVLALEPEPAFLLYQ